MLPILLLALALAAPGQDTLHVSARSGSDADADGTREHPFRTITAAIALADPERGADIRVDLGTYDAAGGESFPLRLGSGLRITGLGSALTVIDGGDAPLVADASGIDASSLILGGLSFAGGQRGLLLVTPAVQDSAVALRDVAFRGSQVGIAVELASDAEAGWLGLMAEGLRVVGCERGVSVRGTAPLVLDLESSVFEDCDIGLFLEADPEEDPSKLGEEDAPEYLRVHHDLSVRNTRFAGCRTAGVRRQGADGKNNGPPYVFEDCTFQANEVGLELQRPCADTGFLVRRSRFLENVRFGLHVTGRVGEADAFNRVEDSLFRWNGVGVHATSTNLELVRDRIVENLGNGVFSSNFLADPTVTVIADSLLANNGAGGFYGLADARLLTVRFARSTVAFNAQAGVRNHTRHAGTSHYELRDCIVAGNGEDLSGLGEESVIGSWIGDGSALREDASLQGDPGFAAPELRDYRLREDSPCVGRGSMAADSGEGQLDLDGHPRPDGESDLGAYERP